MNGPAPQTGGVDPLAALRPLREPELVGWWPPAPGWWILAALVLLALGGLLWWWLQRRRREAYRQRAVVALLRIREDYERSGDGLACLAGTNALLKSVALQAFPRRDVAAMSGECWRAFLNESCAAELFDQALLEAQYRPQPPGAEVNRQLSAAQQWLLQHRRPA